VVAEVAKREKAQMNSGVDGVIYTKLGVNSWGSSRNSNRSFPNASCADVEGEIGM